VSQNYASTIEPKVVPEASITQAFWKCGDKKQLANASPKTKAKTFIGEKNARRSIRKAEARKLPINHCRTE
jgi:hypothetical protein